IVHTVSEKGSVRVTELSKLFGITAETIRRDLEKLEQSGKLIRSHGGAVSVQEKQIDTPFFERETEQVSEKKKIAKIALEFIKEVRTKSKINYIPRGSRIKKEETNRHSFF